MRVTSKGQVTIPIEVRKELGIKPGSEVDFVSDGNIVRLVASTENKFDPEAFRRTLDRMEGTIDLDGMTTDEYMLWLRGPRDDLNAD